MVAKTYITALLGPKRPGCPLLLIQVAGRLTWNGGCDCWLDGVGLLHKGLDAGKKWSIRVKIMDAVVAPAQAWPWSAVGLPPYPSVRIPACSGIAHSMESYIYLKEVSTSKGEATQQAAEVETPTTSTNDVVG